jgi:signal transduction histidine kinase
MVERGATVSQPHDGPEVGRDESGSEPARPDTDLVALLHRLGGVGAWEVDLSTGALHTTAGMARFFGLAPERLPRTWQESDRHTDPRSREAFSAAIRAAVARGESTWSAELTIVRADGEPVPVRVVGEIDHVDGALLRIRGVTHDISEEVRVRRALDQRAFADRLERQNRALVAIATDPVVQDPARPLEAQRRLLEMAAEPMEVERVGLWWFEDDERLLRCSDLYLRSAHAHSSAPDVVMETCPRYRDALLAGRAIDAHDARSDARTTEFLPYLEAHGITSMLDVPFRLGGRLAGVVCFEHVGPPRRWTADEVAFAAAVADHVAQCALHRQRAEALDALRRLAADLERRVAERTADLERANRELESFVYSVSHDLRAPLRGIEGFARALEEDAGAGLAADGREHLARIQRASRRMGEMIDDLLRLSGVVRAPLALEEVDVSAMAASVVEQLRQRQPERRVDCTIEPGLRAWADRGLLRIALENLLENAWKFTATRPVAHVQVRAGADPAEILVVDDGVGFDPSRADKLFHAFQRLHKERDFPGTGVGLATVARIALRHGGSVRAASGPEGGATFGIRLPSAPVAAGDPPGIPSPQ